MATQNFAGASMSVVAASTRELVYESPALTQSVIHSIYVSNSDAVLDVSVDIEVEKTGVVFKYLGRNLPVPNGGTLVFDKPITIAAGEKIHITATIASIDVTISVLQVVA